MKSLRRVISNTAILMVLGAGVAAAQANQPNQPNHTHYIKPEAPPPPAPSGAVAPRLQNLGKHAFPVSCKGAGVQVFFNQGINLTYGFNHMEAGRAFEEVARRSPDCAMAYWGQALVLGPNINAPMDPAHEPKALELVQKAISLKAKASPRERAYIDALAARYSGKAEDRGARDHAYADAMRKLAARYPADLEAATMFAESMMDLRPWNYWTRDGVPYEGTNETVAAVAKVMQANPNHPGALHLWIHLLEATKNPERAEEAADRLLPLVPGAGHLVHMSGHIFQRVGRYADVVKANQSAIAADEDYITQCRAQGIYPLAYYPHNLHFLWFGATMAGQRALTLESARKTAGAVPQNLVEKFPFLQGFLVVPYQALVRFGEWEEILDEPEPQFKSSFMLGMWHYMRGRAFVALNKLDEAQKELDTVTKMAADPAIANMPASFSANSAGRIVAIAPHVLAGELAAKRRDYDAAVLHLERAVRLQDALIYTEPDDWTYPVRHSLGAVLLEAGRASEAETVFWDDLKRNPENGWALFGVWQALKAQGKDAEAAGVEKRLAKAWANSDIKLSASRF